MKAFGVFEGGGAKGLAHIGALKAAEEREVEFVGLAGASAGAIVAALVAAGYRADELYDLDSRQRPRGAFDFDFLELLDRGTWGRFQALQRSAERFSRHSNLLRLWAGVPAFYWRNRRALSEVVSANGLFRTDRFITWLNDRLKARTNASGPGETVLFQDLPIPLKVVGTDLTSQAIKVFPDSPIDAVAPAVAASISIPFFFRPFRLGRMELVDGGLLSNFPAWLFDEERQQEGPFTPTYGFKLVTPAPPGSRPSRWEFLSKLVAVTLSGDEVLETRQIEDLYIVPLRVSVGTLEFDLSENQKDNLYREGRDGARTFFLKEVPRERRVIVTALRQAHDAMVGILGNACTHLRANIALETNRGRLRIAYSFNMDDDADDRLEFDPGGGACGLCWQSHDFVICDLAEAKTTFATKYKMSKYQQAMVRPSLRSLLCVPIFDASLHDKSRPDVQNPLVGVLNFDSDDVLLAEFSGQGVRDRAENASALLASLLRP